VHRFSARCAQNPNSLVNTMPRYNGMHRFSARYEVIKDLKELGLFRGQKANPGMRLGLSSRTKDVIEPVLKPQWWMDCKQVMIDFAR
jgi:valyl-tRNA synthetase